MSSEERISPEEFDNELEALLTGKEEKKKTHKKKIMVAVAALAILGIAGMKLFNGGTDMIPVVDTVRPVRKTIQNRLTVTGPVSGTDSVDVVSNLHAEILEIPVKEGDKVIKGQTLAVLDDSDVKREAEIARNDYDLAVSTCNEKNKEARNGYAKAVQDLKTAQDNYNRTKALYDGGSVPLVDLETAENGLHDAEREKDAYTVKNGSAVADDSYRLQIEKAKFDYEKAKEQLDNTVLKAPIDGTVVRVNTKVGRFADKMENDAPLFVIENLDNLELEIKVSEYSIGKVEVGQEAEITADILKFIEDGADVVVCSGGMSVDPDDRTPGAIKATGTRIVSYGAPVLPGAMMLVSYYEKDGKKIPILGLPGCVMYAKSTIFDLLLPRLMADDEITADEINHLGEGGLCLNCDVCTFPNCGFGK